MSANDLGIFITIYCFSMISLLLIWYLIKSLIIKKKLREYQNDFERDLKNQVEKIIGELKDENKI